MIRFRQFLSSVAIFWAVMASVAVLVEGVESAEQTKKQTPSFETEVLPILRERCFECHSGNKPQANLDLTTRPSLLRGGESGSAVRTRAAESSLLWVRIAAGEMPPEGPPLTAKQKGIIRTWINEGTLGQDGPASAQPSADLAEITDEDRTFWSFQTPRRPALPVQRASDPLENPIDAFLLAKLAEHGLSFSQEADRRTLIRRVSYDITGLPPLPADVQRFVSDNRPNAYEQLVERQLADPRYGERWGRHWLDVSGYADSAGILSEDRVLPLAYRYRDYVIRSLNEDKPYDRFLLEQLAGDELYDYWHHYANSARLPAPVIDGLTATGFLRCAADSSRPDFATIKNADALYFYPTINDTIQIVSTSTLGLTLQCARCHDHMYDPLPQHDFYRLQAIFMGALRPTQWIPQMERRLKIATKAEEETATARDKEVAERVKELNQQVTELRQKYQERLFEDRVAKLPVANREAVRAAFRAAPQTRTRQQQQLVKLHQTALRPSDEQLSEALRSDYPDYKKQYAKLKGQIQAVERGRIQLEEIRALYDLPGEVQTPLLRRGDALTPGPAVAPGTPSVFDRAALYEWQRPEAGAKTSGRRLAFARWLTDDRHPLTARVMVNRIWLHHFGEGIVATPGDFGRAGAPPSHPKLLDWLAREFVESGWSLKHMHRLVLNSRAYRQRSGGRHPQQSPARRVDPDNRLVWRQRLRRMEAEVLRDTVWYTAGTLSGEMFGSPVPMKRGSDGEVTAGDNQDPRRRSVYLQIRRLTPMTMLQNFDQPVMETNCLRRSRSTVSPQALTILNSDTMVAAANRFADRVLKENPQDPATSAVWLAFARAPADSERRELTEFIHQQTTRYRSESVGDSANAKPSESARSMAVADMCHMLLCANEFIYID